MGTRREKFEEVLGKVYDRGNGNRVRQITGLVAKSFGNNPEELVKYFDSGSGLSRGVATAAYAMISGDFEPIFEREYGGLGIVVSSSPKNIIGKENQFWYAKGKGNAFLDVKGEGNAFCYVEGEESAFWYAKGKGNAFRKPEGEGDSFWNAEGEGDSFYKAKGNGNAFEDVSYSGNAFRDAVVTRKIRKD